MNDDRLDASNPDLPEIRDALQNGAGWKKQVTFETKTQVNWPFASMVVGDSFLVPEGVKRVSINAAMQRAEKSGKGMFVSRTIDGRIRIWRFA